MCCDLGLVNVAMIKTGMDKGFKRSFQLGFGSCFGDLTYLVLALLGVTVIFQIPVVRWVMWIGGTLVLAWMTIQMLRKSLSKQEELAFSGAPTKEGKQFWWGLGLTLSSPTVILWFAVVAGPIIASFGTHDMTTTTVFIAGFFAASVVWSGFIALVSGVSRKWSSARFIRIMSLVSAVLFLILTVKIFMDGWQHLLHPAA
nr:LysE family transporter [Paenibacillus sp. SYP-B3998]